MADSVPCGRWNNRWDICYGTVNLSSQVDINSTPENLQAPSTSALEDFCSLSYWKDKSNNNALSRAGGPVKVTSNRAYEAATQTYGLTANGQTRELKISLKIKVPPAGFKTVTPTATFNSPGAVTCAENTAKQSFRIEIDSSQFRTLPSGTYSGRFTIVAAQAGYPGGSEFLVNVVVNPFVRISGLGDMAITERAADNSGYRQFEDFCVFAVGSEPYSIKASGGDKNTEAFKLNLQGGSAEIGYQVQLTRSGLRKNFVKVSEGQVVESVGASTALDCGGGNNASVRIDIPDTYKKDKPAGSYRGVLYLIVSP